MLSPWWESQYHHHMFLRLQNVGDWLSFQCSLSLFFLMSLPKWKNCCNSFLSFLSVFVLWIISSFLLSYLNSHLCAEEDPGQQKDRVPWSSDVSSWERWCLSVTNAHRGPWGSCAVGPSSLALLECREVPRMHSGERVRKWTSRSVFYSLVIFQMIRFPSCTGALWLKYSILSVTNVTRSL